MAGMGPPPKAPGTRRRTNATLAMTMLPAAGRTGDIPAWPLPDDIAATVDARMAEATAERASAELSDCTDNRRRKSLQRDVDSASRDLALAEAKLSQHRDLEESLWADLWRTPQADLWQRLGWNREVALYVRWQIRGEFGDLDAAKEARQWSDRLGLNPLAMLRLRLEIERTDEAVSRGDRRRTAAPVPAGTTTPAPARSRSRKAKAADDPRALLYSVS